MALLPMVVSLAASAGIVPLVRWLSFRLGRVKLPRQDRWHRKPTPTLGGVAMFFAFCLAMGLFFPYSQPIQAGRWTLLVGPAMMFLLGLIDDLHPLSPMTKLSGQLLSATVVIFFGGYAIQFFPWPVANILLTYFWLIGISNAVNLLDNMDGLAAGVAFIAAGMLGYFAWKAEDAFLLLFQLALMGSILGFLVFNLPPARIFMGDSGSMFLGFSLGLMAVARRSQASNVLAVLGVPVLVFLLPIMDTTLVMITRLLRGQSPAQGGTDHTSHRLVAFGLNERQVLVVLYGVALIGGVSAAALEALDYDTSLGLIPLLLVVLALVSAYLGRLKVVTASQPEHGGIARFVKDLAYRRRLFETLLDLALVGVSYYLAYWTRNGLDMTTASMGQFLHTWPIALACAYFSFFLFGVYRSVWRYIGLYDFLRYIGAAISCSALTWTILALVFPGQGYSLAIMVLFTIFLTLSLIGSRSSFTILDRFYHRQRSQQTNRAILLYGAGDLGEVLVRWLQRSSDLGYRPLGFVEDDETYWGRTIHGVRILGGMDELARWIDELHPEGVVITAGDLQKIHQVTRICQQKGIWARMMRVEFDLLAEQDL